MHVATLTLHTVGRLGHSGVSVEDFDLQPRQRRAVEPVPDQEGAVTSVQRWGHMDPDVLLFI